MQQQINPEPRSPQAIVNQPNGKDLEAKEIKPPSPAPADSPGALKPNSTTKPVLHRQQRIQLQYTPVGVNAQHFKKVFDKLGFEQQIQPVSPSSQIPNTILYGSQVSLEDVKIVAFAFIRAGIVLRSIQPLPNGVPNKETSFIKVVADQQFQDAEPLKVNQILQAGFPLP
ncbi:MAG: hypothetical protein B0A82_12705 [Alkalinema sp. CACIAM 70d]|nr:MAG: hypothetical protein B0A82_12705 [Alkalinema sp. CACIAM 70d]